MEGLHIEPVTSQDTFRIAPGGVGGRPAAAGVGPVDDVIVHQGGGVHHLHHCAQPHHALTVVAERFCRQQQQGRTNAFAAPFAQVVGDIGDGPHTGDGVAHQLALDGA